jgi:hypothetical protein
MMVGGLCFLHSERLSRASLPSEQEFEGLEGLEELGSRGGVRLGAGALRQALR